MMVNEYMQLNTRKLKRKLLKGLKRQWRFDRKDDDWAHLYRQEAEQAKATVRLIRTELKRRGVFTG
jgi:hypothetical protein